MRKNASRPDSENPEWTAEEVRRARQCSTGTRVAARLEADRMQPLAAVRSSRRDAQSPLRAAQFVARPQVNPGRHVRDEGQSTSAAHPYVQRRSPLQSASSSPSPQSRSFTHVLPPLGVIRSLTPSQVVLLGGTQ